MPNISVSRLSTHLIWKYFTFSFYLVFNWGIKELRKRWIYTAFYEWTVMREILGHVVLIEVQQECEQWDVNANNEMSFENDN